MTLKNTILNSFKPGQIFSLQDLNIAQDKKASACVTLSNMVTSHQLCRLAQNAYYLPEKSVIFGTLPPSEAQVIDFICRKTNGYVSGITAYNGMGLTEQVPNIIVIATKNKTQKYQSLIGSKIQLKKAYSSARDKNIQLLQILDAITEIKEIPANTISDSVEKISRIINGLDSQNRIALTDYSKEYPPRTRYILSKIFEKQGCQHEAKQLAATLNNTTRFQYDY